MKHKKSVRTADKHLVSPPLFLSLFRNTLLRYQQCAHAKHVLERSYVYHKQMSNFIWFYVLIHSSWFLNNITANIKILMV